MPGFKRRADVAERRARVLRLRSQQVPYSAIAEQLSIPASTAKSDYRRALEDLTAAQRETSHLAQARELAKLDAMEDAAWKVLRARHITIQQGKIIGKFTGWVTDPDSGEYAHDGDGNRIPVIEEIEDDAPVLQAIDRLVRIAQRRATLTGGDAPAKIEVSDARREQIERLAIQLAAAGGVGDLDGGGAGPAPGDAPGGEGGPDSP